MKTIQTLEKKSNKRLMSFLFGAGIILLIPAILQVAVGSGVDGQGFNWKSDDFVIIGMLLFGIALLCELVLRKVKSNKMRIIICVAILLIFLLVSIDLAVGIFNISGFSGT
jgi:hypothetical protein